MPDGEESEEPETEEAFKEDSVVLAEAVEKMLSLEMLQAATDACRDAVRKCITADTRLGESFDLREVTEDDYHKATNKEQLIELYRRFERWDDFISVEHRRVQKRRSLIGSIMADWMYEPEYDDVYHFDLNASLERVYQRYYLEPKYPILRRRVLEVLIAPGVFDMRLFWRMNQQGLSDEGHFTDSLREEDWSVVEVDFDAPQAAVLQPCQQFCETASVAVSRTVQNLRGKLSD
ncbi:MAG: hypothetical protein OQK00_08900 [Rhodobacteraceae bacterium]|nr:hypothetical protein [Paracoccaceae bacterium]